MPIPYEQECQADMQGVYSARDDLRAALKKVQGLANADTWSGKPGDQWMADAHQVLTAAINALGQPLDDAIQECYATARKLQAQSAHAAAGGH